jgi:pimeloyl-ACP methyl ester carboxylesterase
MIRLLVLLVLLGALLVTACQAESVLNYLTVKGAGGVPLSVVTSGSSEKPAIIFIHGIGQSHYIFHKQLRSSLTDDFYLVAFDLRGHGASGKPWDTAAYTHSATWADDVAAVIAATQAIKPVIVGWSYGTLVALDYIRQYGTSKLSGVALTGSLGALRPFTLPSKEDPNTADFLRVRQLQLSPDPRDQLAAVERMVGWLTTNPVSSSEHRMLKSIAMMFPVYARKAMYSRAQDNQDLLQTLTKLPVFLAMGADDNSGMLKDAQALSKSYSNVRLSVYTDAGHSVFYEQPERFNTELHNFVKTKI